MYQRRLGRVYRGRILADGMERAALLIAAMQAERPADGCDADLHPTSGLLRNASCSQYASVADIT